jgi:hypothetical protein
MFDSILVEHYKKNLDWKRNDEWKKENQNKHVKAYGFTPKHS